jgi:hypothetical protein
MERKMTTLKKRIFTKLNSEFVQKEDFLKAAKERNANHCFLGRWVAKLVPIVRLPATAALWVRIQTSLKNTKWTT